MNNTETTLTHVNGIMHKPEKTIQQDLSDAKTFFISGRKDHKDRAVEIINQLMAQIDNIRNNDLKLKIILTSAWFLKSKEPISSIEQCDEIIKRYNLAAEHHKFASVYSQKKYMLEILEGKLYGDAMRHSFIFDEDHYIHEAKSITSNLQLIIDIKNKLSSQIRVINFLLQNKENFIHKAISNNFYYTSWFSKYLCSVLTALYAKAITDNPINAQEILKINDKKHNLSELKEISDQLFKQSLRMVYQWLNIEKSHIDKGFFNVRGLFLALLLYKKLSKENIIDSSFSIDLKNPDVKTDDFIYENKQQLIRLSEEEGMPLPTFKNLSLFTEEEMLEGVTDVLKESDSIPNCFFD